MMDNFENQKQSNSTGQLNPKKAMALIKKLGLSIITFICLYWLGTFLAPGFDWQISFSIGQFPSIWTPWSKPIVALFNYPAIFALTLLAIGIRCISYQTSPVPLVLAILSLPTLWVIFLGNLDGFALAGLVLLPWGAPLVLMKPQIAAFALLAKRSYLTLAVIWLLFSFLIWGLWPLNWGVMFTPAWKVEWVQDISLFPWGLLIALPLLWLSRGDEDLLMAAGSLCTPHLFPYHYIVLMPALARMRWPWMLATWVISFTPLLANWLGPTAWHFGNLLGVFFWLGIYLNLKPEKHRSWRLSRPLDWRDFFSA